ncbi:hypothetical protein [Streptomyces sp. SD15]
MILDKRSAMLLVLIGCGATLRKRAGRWVPRVEWDLVQLVFGVVAAWGRPA